MNLFRRKICLGFSLGWFVVYWFAYLQVGLRVGLEVIEGWVCQKTRWAREPKSKTAHSTPFLENVVVWAAVLWAKSM